MFFGGDWWGSGHGSLNNMRNGRNSRNSSSFNCLTWSWTLPSWMVMPRGGLRLFSDLELEVYSGSNVSPHFLGKGYPPRAWHFGPLKPLQTSAAWCVVCSKEHWSGPNFCRSHFAEVCWCFWKLQSCKSLLKVAKQSLTTQCLWLAVSWWSICFCGAWLSNPRHGCQISVVVRVLARRYDALWLPFFLVTKDKHWICLKRIL